MSSPSENTIRKIYENKACATVHHSSQEFAMKDKALGKSISFRPFSLYLEAVAYGQKQRPSLNVSEVTCHFLRLGLDGAEGGELQRLATELRRLGGDPEQTLRTAIAAMEDPVIAPSPLASRP